MQKNGGNVASYFLTPTGHVIHSVTGPVKPEVLLEEAKWALEVYREAKSLRYPTRMQFLASSHQRASMSARSNQDRKVHELLMNNPFPLLRDVYVTVFQDILGQRVSKAGPRLAQAANILERAKKSGRPILFVLHEGTSWSPPPVKHTYQAILNNYFVIVMPLREAPALSQLTKQPPFESSRNARPLFVVARSDCTQLRAIAGWNEQHLTHALAEGWVDFIERKPPRISDMVRAQRLLRSVDDDLEKRVRDVTVREKSRIEKQAQTKRNEIEART